jgi:hypothetical protein
MPEQIVGAIIDGAVGVVPDVSVDPRTSWWKIIVGVVIFFIVVLILLWIASLF